MLVSAELAECIAEGIVVELAIFLAQSSIFAVSLTIEYVQSEPEEYTG